MRTQVHSSASVSCCVVSRAGWPCSMPHSCVLGFFCVTARVHFATTAVTATYGNNIRDKSIAHFSLAFLVRCCFSVSPAAACIAANCNTFDLFHFCIRKIPSYFILYEFCCRLPFAEFNFFAATPACQLSPNANNSTVSAWQWHRKLFHLPTLKKSKHRINFNLIIISENSSTRKKRNFHFAQYKYVRARWMHAQCEEKMQYVQCGKRKKNISFWMKLNETENSCGPKQSQRIYRIHICTLETDGDMANVIGLNVDIWVLTHRMTMCVCLCVSNGCKS